MPTTVDRTGWTDLLREVTLRNAGRLVRVEVDDPEIGAQVAESAAPLQGLAFDPHDGCVEVMVGEYGSGGAHLTHSVLATAVEVQRDAEGRDLALRVAHDGGQTLLRFL